MRTKTKQADKRAGQRFYVIMLVPSVLPLPYKNNMRG